MGQALEKSEYFSRVRFVLWVVLWLNLAVAAAKLAIGLMTGSVAITADGYHSFSDGISNVVGLVGLAWASRPVDCCHPYGHQKYETLAAVGIAALLFMVALNVAREAVQRIYSHSVPHVTLLSFGVMLATMAVNIVVMRYERREGRRLGSEILVSDSRHTSADLFTSASVLGTLVAISLGWPVFDVITAFIVAVFIVWAGISVLRENMEVLADRAPISEHDIWLICRQVPGVKDCHRIRSRGRLDDIYVDLHVLLEGRMAVERAHQIASLIESDLKRHINGIRDVTVHIEPDTEAERCEG
ncbi:MAG: cation diffusion facilitator family transporter [Pseudomonadota bacterium]